MALIMSHFNPLHIRITYLSKSYATLICHVYMKWYREAVQPKLFFFALCDSLIHYCYISHPSHPGVTEHNLHKCKLIYCFSVFINFQITTVFFV